MLPVSFKNSGSFLTSCQPVEDSPSCPYHNSIPPVVPPNKMGGQRAHLSNH